MSRPAGAGGTEPSDPHLAELVAAWAGLSPAVRRQILEAARPSET
jgi:hypothetical protein